MRSPSSASATVEFDVIIGGFRARRRTSRRRWSTAAAKPEHVQRHRRSLAAATTRVDDAARRSRAESAVHVRDLRQGRLQPVRAGCRTAGGRNACPQLQPAVHLRLGRSRQDPPAARDRPLRAQQLPAPRRALRLDRDVHERVRRRDPLQLDGRPATQVPRNRRAADRRRPVPRRQRRAPGGVLPHVQLAARCQQADRDLLRPDARCDPHARGTAARPVQVGPDHRHPAARPRDPARDPAQQGRTRTGPGARRDPRVHRLQDLDQHP